MTNNVKISRTHVLAGCFEYTNADNEDAFDRHVYAIYPNCIRRIARVERYTRQMLKMRRRWSDPALIYGGQIPEESNRDWY